MKLSNRFRQFTFIFTLVSCASFMHAQRIIVNNNGDRIVIYPDGSWRAVEAGDSVLLRRNIMKSESIGIQNENQFPLDNRNPGDHEDYILRQWNELHFHIKDLEKSIQDEFRKATNAQFRAAELLSNAEADKSLLEPVHLATLHDNYDESVRNLKKAKLNQKAVRRIADQSKKMASLPPDKMERKLNLLRSKFNSFLASYDPGRSLPVPEMQDKRYDSKINKETSQKQNVKSDPDPAAVTASQKYSGDVPPQNLSKPYKSEPFRCKVLSDTVDEITGRRRIELNPDLIFTHTEPDLRPYFKNKELITCYGKLSKIDAYVYFTIDFQIASSHSQSNFGSLQNGSLLRLSLLNGQYVSLYNIKSDKGRIDPYSGNTVFTGQYALGKNDIDLLLSSELDKFRILWSTGYEDYDIYKVDFFIDQLKCLLKT